MKEMSEGKCILNWNWKGNQKNTEKEKKELFSFSYTNVRHYVN
jgi:hypothetical protein